MRPGPRPLRILTIAVAVIAVALALALEAHHYRLYQQYRHAEHSMREMEPIQQEMAERRRRTGDVTGAEKFDRLIERTRNSAEQYARLKRQHGRWLWR